MSYVGKININNSNSSSPIGTTLLGTCETEAGTTPKLVKFTNDAFDVFTDNITIKVKFKYTNTVSNVALKIVGYDGTKITDPVLVKTYDSDEGVPGITPNSSWYAGEVVTFTYIQGRQDNPSFWYMSPKGGVDVESQTVVKSIDQSTKTEFSLNGTTLNITTTNVNPSTKNINTVKS